MKTKEERLLALGQKIATCEDRLADAEYDSVIDRLEERLEKLQEEYDDLEEELDGDLWTR